MKNVRFISIIILVVFVSISIPSTSSAANRLSIGFTGGISQPIGWWGERWDPLQSSEINLRYEFKSGFGILLFVGLNKTYFTPISEDEVYAESRYHDVYPEFEQYKTIISANQDGAFKQLPIGFGFYYERMIWPFRTYGSLAMSVYNWKFERSQQFEQVIALPGVTPVEHEDNWSIVQDGTDLGAQVAVGMVYSVTRMLHLDLSAAYHLVNINREYGAAAYWGEPARIPPGKPENMLVKDAKGSVDFIQLRFGIRYGT